MSTRDLALLSHLYQQHIQHYLLVEVHFNPLLCRLLHLIVDVHNIVLVKLLEGYLSGLCGLFSDIECLTIVAEMQVAVFFVLKTHPLATELTFLET